MAPTKPESPHDSFARGIEQFNRRRFFEAHESWEEVWLRALEPDKTFLQGIIQVAAGLHHYTRGNLDGAESLLRAGLAKLEQFPTNCRGLNVEGLRAAARKWLAALASGNSPGPESFPRIERL